VFVSTTLFSSGFFFSSEVTEECERKVNLIVKARVEVKKCRRKRKHRRIQIPSNPTLFLKP